MDNSTKKIISIITMDKRETGKKSTNMEKACFLKAMDEVQDKHNVQIQEVVTDAHLQIGALMSKSISLFYKNTHQVSVPI